MIKVEYFHNPVCPYCPAAKTLITKVLKGFKDVELVEVDTFTDEGITRGMSLNLRAVPAIAINGVVKITGWPFEEWDLLACIKEACEK